MCKPEVTEQTDNTDVARSLDVENDTAAILHVTNIKYSCYSEGDRKTARDRVEKRQDDVTKREKKNIDSMC